MRSPGALGARLPLKSDGLDSPVSEAPISCLPHRSHLREHRLVLIDVVLADDVEFRGAQAVHAAGILGQGSAPRVRHCQKESVEPYVVEALAEIASGSDKHPFLIIWDRHQRFGCRSRLTCTHAATENYDTIYHARRVPRVVEAEGPVAGKPVHAQHDPVDLKVATQALQHRNMW